MSAPEGYRKCSKRACSRWTYAPAACWTCCTPKGPDSVITAAMVASDWTPPIAAPAAHIDATPEPAKPLMLGDLAKDPGLLERLRTSPPAQEAPKQWKEHARCGFPIVSSNREAAVTAVGKHQATCEKCSAQEAPKAAPALEWSFTDDENRVHRFATGIERDDASRAYGAWMKAQAGKPYAGPERLPKPQLAADWVEDCLPTVWR